MVNALPAPRALLAILQDPGVTDVLINGPDAVWVDGADGLRRVALHLGDAVAIRSLAVALAAHAGRRLDDSSPTVDAHLPGGIRMHAIVPPVAPFGPLISFRVFRREALTLSDLERSGSIDSLGSSLLEALVAARVNLLVSGGTGAGKTTLLAALVGLSPPSQRIVLIEEALEIITAHQHCVRLEARAANAEGRGLVSLTELVRESLRMRPDRIVLGECRGPEVREVLAALNTGHEGSMATIHANCCSNVPARLVALGSLAGLDRRAVAVQAAAALGAVIHLARVGPQAGLTEAAPAGMRTQSESGGSAQRAGIVAAVRATTGPQAGSDRSIHRARRAVTELALFRLVGSELEALPAVVWSPDGPRTGPGWQALITRLSRAIGDDQRFDGLLRSERQASQGDERQASQGDLA